MTITDNNGCTTTRSVTITQPTALTSSTSSTTNATCNGASTGAFTVAASGGTSPYTFNHGTGAQASGTFTGLTAGTYNVTITDNNGCTTTRAVNITQPAAVAGSTSSTGESCTGNDGSATVTASGGTAPYGFAWSNSGNSATINGLIAGSYTVTITDANGCSTTRSVVVANNCAPCAISSTASSNNASCNGLCNGSTTVTPSGGTAPYSYVWGDGANTGTRSGLCAGVYDVTVIDASACSATQSITITEPTALGASATASSTPCVANSGTTTATATGGTSPYSFVWSNGSSTATNSGLAAGAYSVTVTDANGCSTTANATVNTIPTAATASATGTNPNCATATDGAASLSLSGGTAPFSFLWNNGATTQNISAIGAGNYSVTVTDANGCISTATATLTDPTAITVTATGSNPNCPTATDGAINLSFTGGTAPFSFLWSNGATTQNISAIAAGSYSVTITDANACASTTSTTLNDPTTLVANGVGTNPTSSSSNDGSIDLTATGGTAPYTYVWSNGATTEDLNGLAVGTYTVTITDNNGCETVETVSLIVVAVQPIEIVQNFDVLPNPNNGAFLIQVELNEVQDLQIELIDVLGRRLREWNFSQESQITVPVDISEQAGGMYLIVLRTADGKLQTRKVTIGK